MRNPATSLALFVALAGAAACAGELPTGTAASSPEALSFQAHQPTERPLRGSCTVTSVELISFVPPILQQRSTAECRVSHLGLMHLVTMQTINVGTGAQVGTSELTAANGDLLYVSSQGTSTPTGPTTIAFGGTTTINGGTGRFAEATGILSVDGWADNSASTGAFTYDGWISYEASARGNR
jgi:acyl-coenzyme A thioesterase PaaI-like protein